MNFLFSFLSYALLIGAFASMLVYTDEKYSMSYIVTWIICFVLSVCFFVLSINDIYMSKELYTNVFSITQFGAYKGISFIGLSLAAGSLLGTMALNATATKKDLTRRNLYLCVLGLLLGTIPLLYMQSLVIDYSILTFL